MAKIKMGKNVKMANNTQPAPSSAGDDFDDEWTDEDEEVLDLLRLDTRKSDIGTVSGLFYRYEE
ncbi:hypothetical protein NECAME_06738 [Necator americanus]|uniref:Uncharacterized protein n=1 Tax=Necator americanus TaxID=51031 RepID=W2TSB4_NECAM|nr:hypothetical protein NECAME_06738 [Necator americanus]ETN84708.1 hypothetical protein NECAME_06738 [Necator americanus]